MVQDARTLESDEVLEADICIAGGGAAGITLARELRGSGAEVLLLEAGPESRDEDHQTLYEGETSGEADASQLKNSRLRAFGGTTGHWSGWCQALEPIDFESRDWIPRSGWPLDRETLDPFYRRAVDYVEIGASEWDASTIMERAGRALLPFDETHATSVLYQYSPPTRFGEAYGDDLEAADNVEVYLHANVVHIALNANGDAVERLECETLEGNSFTAEADEFVVAMGGLETPRMLLASNDRKSDGIGNDHGHLGRYFMEHIHIYGGALLAADASTDFSTYRGRQTVETRDEDHPDGREADVEIGFGLPESVRRDEQLQAMTVMIRSAEFESDPGGVDPIRASQIRDTLMPGDEGKLFELDLRAEQRPLRRSRITLTDETDALGVPRMEFAWHVSEADFEHMRRSLQHIAAAFGELGIGRLWYPNNPYEKWLEQLRGGAHHMGTTRMSARPEKGVVDADCKVHGVDNLYVGGSSIYPSVGAANPTLTLVALAIRLADHLEAQV